MNSPGVPPLPLQRSGAGLTLVLAHGYLGGSRLWAVEIEHLRHPFDVIAIDFSGERTALFYALVFGFLAAPGGPRAGASA